SNASRSLVKRRKYLCEYIFSSSLKENNERTAFIHVPEVRDDCPLEDIATSLQYTIQTIINEVLETKQML
ncbi:unnamed protein product, partial [Medioppia subpectinata]